MPYGKFLYVGTVPYSSFSVYIIGFLTCVLTLDSFGCLRPISLYNVMWYLWMVFIILKMDKKCTMSTNEFYYAVYLYYWLTKSNLLKQFSLLLACVKFMIIINAKSISRTWCYPATQIVKKSWWNEKHFVKCSTSNL